jgi:hypothetical protein
MADDEKDELTPAEEANFGGQPQGEEPTGYIANFDGDEVDGKRYKMGDRLADDVDAGTIAYLVQNGRFTPTTAGAAGSPSGGDSSDPAIPTGEDPGHKSDSPEKSDAPELNADEQAEADALVNSSSKDDLLGTAKAEGIEGVTADNNKAEIAAKIIAARRA